MIMITVAIIKLSAKQLSKTVPLFYYWIVNKILSGERFKGKD